MIDRRFVLSLLLDLVAGTLGTMAHVAGRRSLWRFEAVPMHLRPKGSIHSRY
jgi:hypothetical protein